MLILQNLTYFHPDRTLLFDNLHLTLQRGDKVALVGNNGAGKSTLLRIMAGILPPSQGQINADERPYYVPQHFGQYNDCSIAQALQIDIKLKALQAILEGEVSEENMTLLDDDWTVEERCREALDHWGLGYLRLTDAMSRLSGGQKTRVFLAGIRIHHPAIVLMDEPTNHLDGAGRQLLYDDIDAGNAAMVIVSHDRTLLNRLGMVWELDKRGLTQYGGNYDFYQEQKALERQALNEDLKDKEKALRKARETERESLERQQKLDARGRKKQEKAGLPTISLNTFRNNAEKSTARMKDVHAGKIDALSGELAELRKELPGKERMKLGFDDSLLHRGKILVSAQEINFGYEDRLLWPRPLSLVITSGERIALKGDNGSGKTSLVRMLLGEAAPQQGKVERAAFSSVYIDQDYSLISDRLTVLEQAQQFNSEALEEHEVKSRLTHFLFTQGSWDKPCAVLSGGEKMRLVLCCLSIGNRTPDLIVLDEPTNNLDLLNVEILTQAIRDYRGTLIVISHDEHFLEELEVERSILLG